ncbi:MAG: site-2 protease family protein [Chloroflexi bacterium]|nr:site-2 protease family protein [Chloroflexota bacterium]
MNVVFWLVGTLVVVLGPIILIHELGHFIFAKLAGVRVEEFGFGFPPRLLKLWRGKGYLNIGVMRVIIPAGFRLPPGLAAGVHVDAVAHKRDDGTCVLRRLTMLDLDTEYRELNSEATHEGLHLRGELTTFEPGTLYSLNWLPMGAFVKMTGEEDPSDPLSLAVQPKRWRVAVMAAGPVFNIIAALVLLVGAYASGCPEWQVEIASVQPGSAAEEAGLQPYDIVMAVDGERIKEGTEHLQRLIYAAPEQTVELTVLRGEETLTIMATPQRQPEGHGLLGIVISSYWPGQNAVRRYPLSEALSASINDITAAILMTVQVPAQLAQGDITPQEARPTSVVGISEILAISLQQSIEWRLAFPALQTASFISLALGLANLLPLPALDGGRIFLVLIEAVRGRRISPEREMTIHSVGLMILIGLMALMMLQDLINPIIPWSWLK